MSQKLCLKGEEKIKAKTKNDVKVRRRKSSFRD